MLLSRRRCCRPFLDRLLQFCAQSSHLRLLQPRLQGSFQEHTSVRLSLLLQLLEDADTHSVRLAKGYKRHVESQPEHSCPWADRGFLRSGRTTIGGPQHEGSCYSRNKSWGTSEVRGCCRTTWATQTVACLVRTHVVLPKVENCYNCLFCCLPVFYRSEDCDSTLSSHVRGTWNKRVSHVLVKY